MKVRLRDYIGLFTSILFKRPAKQVIKKAKYLAELGGKNGYEVNGIEGYWGRFASIDKIVELSKSLDNEDDLFTFYFPDEKSGNKYCHQIGIYWNLKDQIVDLEFLESGNQCGSYFKEVSIQNLANEINQLGDVSLGPESYGYVYEES